MREQVCLYMCPWPRIQAALTDDDALNVTYGCDRGEPRDVAEGGRTGCGRMGSPPAIASTAMQCVAVCPTGVDIRKGSQLGCIQCGLCIDACDAVMAKINRPIRLITYDTDENIKRRKRGEAHRLPSDPPANDSCTPHRSWRSRRASCFTSLATRSNWPRACCTCVRRSTPRLPRAASATAIRCGSPTNWNEPRTFAIEIGGVKGATAKQRGDRYAALRALAVTRRSRRDPGNRVLRDGAALLGVSRPAIRS